MARENPQVDLNQTREKFETVSQELTHFTQCIERQQQALYRLRHALQSGESLMNDDRLVREMVEAASAARAAAESLGITYPIGDTVQSESDSTSENSLEIKEHERLLAICSVSQTVNSTLDLTQVLNIVMDTIVRLTGAERGFVMLLDEETGELAFRTARNMDQETMGGSSFQISLGIVNRVASESRPVVTTNAQADPRFSTHKSIMNYSLRSILCVPLLVKNQVIGVIYVDSRIKTALFSERDLDILVTFANQVATAIDNARLFENVTMSKNLLDNIFASIPSGVITIDISDKITSLNPVAEKILGIPTKICLGSPYTRIFEEAWGTDLAPLVEQVRTREQRFVGYEIEPNLPKRGTLNLTLSLSPLKDDNEVCQGVAVVVDDLTETKRLQAVREMFRCYVSPAVVDRLPSDAKKLRLGGSRQEISVLFADIRGFTALSEGLDPEELIVILNRYLSLAARAVLAYEGTLDKFMGDAVMAIFNAPLPQEDHPLRAVKAALTIQEKMEKLHHGHGSTLPYMQYGIGINVGDSVVGNVGTPAQMNYTTIGDTVNLASRLQEVAEGGQILLSQSAYERVADHVEVKVLKPIRVKGRKSLEHIYELTAIK